MHEHPKRPAVADDVVQRHEQEMLLLAQPQQAAPQERALRQVEGALAFFLHQAPGFAFPLGLGQCTQVSHHQGHVPGGSNDLHQLPIDGGKGGPQGFMASENLIEALLQDRHVERTQQTYDIGDVEQGQAREQLVEEPEVFLGNGRWQCPLPWYGHNRRGLQSLLCLAVLSQ